MKRQFAVILLLISILSLSGCHKEPSTPKALVPSIMYNGEIYCSTGKQMPGEVAEDAIIGEITSTISMARGGRTGKLRYSRRCLCKHLRWACCFHR